MTRYSGNSPARTILPLIVFLAGFSILVWVVCDYFLIPALAAADEATPQQKHQLVAHSRLLLAIVLVVLCMGILMLSRIRRLFFPAPPSERQKTEYIDAWAEAGRRIDPPSQNTGE